MRKCDEFSILANSVTSWPKLCRSLAKRWMWQMLTNICNMFGEKKVCRAFVHASFRESELPAFQGNTTLGCVNKSQEMFVVVTTIFWAMGASLWA